MSRRGQATIQELRTAIECLPTRTKVAMLDGISANRIIVGAYTDGRGGVCPMLAAHRAGGRTDFIGFAKAWDRLGKPSDRGRRASRRELLILKTHLEASLLDNEMPATDLAVAVAEHRELVARHGPGTSLPRRARRGAGQDATRGEGQKQGTKQPRPGDADRSRELRGRPGWAWLRVFRRYDDYERALALVEAEHRALADERELEPVE